ncbi:MAG: GAF domain-containing protein [Flavobacteriaceae bacterium]|nr:GAF domain-containing protein [Flavobacteriaceae bacterium]
MKKNLTNINEGLHLPFRIRVSFKKLISEYEQHANSSNPLLADRANKILEVKEQFPILTEGFEEVQVLKDNKSAIKEILEDTFTTVLTKNEIKAATVPFQSLVFNKSKRFKNILKTAGEDFELKIFNVSDDEKYIMACLIILMSHYQVNIDYSRPLFYNIPDENNIMRSYRILYNADYMEMIPTEEAKNLSQEDIRLLLDNFDDIDLWKEKFPPNSYIASGIVISNMFDLTADQSISTLKSNLLIQDKPNQASNDHMIDEFEQIFRSLFKLPELRVGFTLYNEDENMFEAVPIPGVNSYILMDKDSLSCDNSLCNNSYDQLVEKKKYFSISDLERELKNKPENSTFQNLVDSGYKSAVFAPITDKHQVLAILEIISPEAYDLHSVNANKLDNVMPFLLSEVLRSKKAEENHIGAFIQKEFTSIHPSVSWKFEQEAKRYLREESQGHDPDIKDIVFEDVYPLYGQIDIRHSSAARNNAIRKDLKAQLQLLLEIFAETKREEGLPIYDEILFRLEYFSQQIQKEYRTDSEETISDFFEEEIHPHLDHIQNLTSKLEAMVVNYQLSTNQEEGVYHFRKDYDHSVRIINNEMATIIDNKQLEAQQMFPHMFERYKTDGVEHNMFIGASISQSRKFSLIYLQNLRLWQLQTMCEMENAFYQLQSELPIRLEVASLILVHSSPLSIRFRLDEHKFDVDGTYNAKYEVIKKRLDKAFIKSTQERITQAGKITIVYSNKKDENEYKRYLQLLHAKNLVSNNIELLEVEPLQGVSGLKALRADVLYNTTEATDRLYKLEELKKL